MKRVLSLILAMLLLAAVTGCGAGKEKEVDVPGLATALAARVRSDSDMRALTAEQLGNYLTLPEGAEAAAYMSNGTTAEEIIVVRCAGEDDARALKADIQTFLADQRTEMERYQPQEVARLESAILVQKGNCVVLCVTADTETAESVIKEYLG